MNDAPNLSAPIIVTPPPPIDSAYGSFSARALALSLDQFILFFVILVMLFPVAIIAGVASLIAWPFVFVVIAPPILPVTTIIAWLYFSLQESSKHQATFGKRLCGLRVTDMQGNRVTFARATLRFFGKFLSSAIMMIGWVMAAFTERHQALHDIVAETLVLKKIK